MAHAILLAADRSGWCSIFCTRNLLDSSGRELPDRLEYDVQVALAYSEASKDALEATARRDAQQIVEHLFQPSYWNFAHTAVTVSPSSAQNISDHGATRRDEASSQGLWRPSWPIGRIAWR